MLTLSQDDAARFLVRYHLEETDIPGVMDRLGTVQYDPLKPVGRNPDLVFQARVSEYQVDDWQSAAYRDRIMYDAWDKQACLVPVSDWPERAPIRARYHPWHDREILREHPGAAIATLAEIDRKGPLSSLEFEDRTRAAKRHSWYGPTIIKRILRALWARGDLVTHHRESGRHYYDRPERVIPEQHIKRPALEDFDTYHRWVMLRRHIAAGMLRPKASQEIWSACGDSAARAAAIAELVEDGSLTPAMVGDKPVLYHIPTRALSLLDAPPGTPRMVVLGPLDNLLWDRQTINKVFGFDYVWEVYKKAEHRRWGYYVLPVMYGDRFVARFESRLEADVWNIMDWWWEDGISINDELLETLTIAGRRFMRYLRADKIRITSALESPCRRALLASAG